MILLHQYYYGKLLMIEMNQYETLMWQWWKCVLRKLLLSLYKEMMKMCSKEIIMKPLCGEMCVQRGMRFNRIIVYGLFMHHTSVIVGLSLEDSCSTNVTHMHS